MAGALWGFLFGKTADHSWRKGGTMSDRMDDEDNVLDELLNEIGALLNEYPRAIERRAAIIEATGKDPELVHRLIMAAQTMRDSGNLYLTWARHYAAMAIGNTDAATEEDETDDLDV
ncbi:MAG: hypothetical protein NZM29_00400 [Nitrospira sp.]|nr:hypothetical protein [Nitrospira sp.]